MKIKVDKAYSKETIGCLTVLIRNGEFAKHILETSPKDLTDHEIDAIMAITASMNFTAGLEELHEEFYEVRKMEWNSKNNRYEKRQLENNGDT